MCRTRKVAINVAAMIGNHESKATVGEFEHEHYSRERCLHRRHRSWPPHRRARRLRSGDPGHRWIHTAPKNAPNTAPVARNGVNTPPDAPLPNVRAVTRGFSANRAKKRPRPPDARGRPRGPYPCRCRKVAETRFRARRRTRNARGIIQKIDAPLARWCAHQPMRRTYETARSPMTTPATSDQTINEPLKRYDGDVGIGRSARQVHPRDHGRDQRTRQRGQNGRQGETPKQHFSGEDRATEWHVVDRRESCAAAAGDEQALLGGREFQPVRRDAARRAAHQFGRGLAANGRTHANDHFGRD